MEVKQVAQIVNNATAQALGESAILNEDLSNVVDIGGTIEEKMGLDTYVRALPNVIGRMIFVDRPYYGRVPSLIMDSTEFGSIVAKYRGEMPEAEENESWELEDNTSYDMSIFTKPKVFSKFFNKMVTYEIPLSITEKQVKQSFHNAAELNAFISMLYNDVDKSMTVKMDSLAMRTVNNLIAETIYDGVGSTYSGTSIRAVNLLNLYNTKYSKTLTASLALSDPDFIRFAIYTIQLYKKRMETISTLFNIGGTQKFTPREYMREILLSDFASSASVYLYDGNGQFRTDNLSLGSFETVPYWQGSGADYTFGDITNINVKTAAGNNVNVTGVIGVIFDRDAAGITNMSRRVTVAPYNGKGEFWNYWHKWDCSYFNDTDENCVVFFIHD